MASCVAISHEDKDDDKRPVTTINVRSLIQQPLDYQILDAGIHNIDGIAWTGEGKIIKVEISVDEGKTWELQMVDFNLLKLSGIEKDMGIMPYLL